ncbi:MAG TPA: hypothetical protein VI136_26660 [Verrucomicrobiae bacterium]
MIFSFGQTQHERIEVDVLKYERDPVGDYHDDNWLWVKIRVQAGGFCGKTDAAILTTELLGFLERLRVLHDTLEGSAEFSTLEEQLTLNLAADSKGHVELRGEVLDQPGIDNKLHFTLSFDQSQLRASIRELEKVLSAFPVREVQRRG